VNDEPVAVRSVDVPAVFVVDDDSDVRESLEQLLKSVGMKASVFARGEALIDALERAGSIDGPVCIVLDVRLQGLSGLMVQQELSRRGISYPVIFVTGHGDIVMTVKAMKAGAVNFLTKPVRDQDLLEAIAEAIDLERMRIADETSTQDLKARWLELTPRQRQVMRLVAYGLPDGEIADELGITEITAKIYRSEGMRRLGTKTLCAFVAKAKILGIIAGASQSVCRVVMRGQ
jgi:FixJ family two-component response regulator